MNVKNLIGSLAIGASFLVAHVAVAQAPAGAPAGATAVCKDGTYFTGATKSGACRGHQGIKTWFGATSTNSKSTTTKAASLSAPASTSKSSKSKTVAATASAPAPSAPAPAPKPAPVATPAPPATPAPAASTSSTKSKTSTMAQAPGGGPGLVWLNTASNVYHCPGTQYYGKTKAGAYMTEADAKAKGAHAVGGKACK